MKRNNSSPLISIIVPVYNSEKYLNDCISSILKQSYPNIEVIFINDGSTDKSLDILNGILDSRVKVLSQDNSGAAEARNAGLKKAKGDYVCFVDSDDMIDDHYVEVLFETAQQSSADIVCTDYTYMTNTRPKSTNRTSDFKCISEDEAVRQLLTERISSAPHSKLFKYKVIKDVSFPRLTIAEDLLFNYWSIQKAKTIAISHCALYYYRQNMLGLTKKKFETSRMDGLTATKQIMKLESFSKPSIIRAFMEAHYILESMGHQKNMSDYKEQCFRIIRKYRFSVLFTKKASVKQRIFAALSIISPMLPSKIVLLKRRNK